jgi:DNA-binding Lrp family transcriptional regulator
MKAIVLLKIDAGEIKETCRFLKRTKSIAETYATLGPYDAIAIIQADSLKEIGRIVVSEIQPIPGVTETLTCLMIADVPNGDITGEEQLKAITSLGLGA